MRLELDENHKWTAAIDRWDSANWNDLPGSRLSGNGQDWATSRDGRQIAVLNGNELEIICDAGQISVARGKDDTAKRVTAATFSGNGLEFALADKDLSDAVQLENKMHPGVIVAVADEYAGGYSIHRFNAITGEPERVLLASQEFWALFH